MTHTQKQQDILRAANNIKDRLIGFEAPGRHKAKARMLEDMKQVTQDILVLAMHGLRDDVFLSHGVQVNEFRGLMMYVGDAMALFAEGKTVEKVARCFESNNPGFIRNFDAVMAQNGYHAVEDDFGREHYVVAEAKAA